MKRRVCSYDIVEVPGDAYVVTDAEGELYLCNARCLCLWAMALATKPNLSPALKTQPLSWRSIGLRLWRDGRVPMLLERMISSGFCLCVGSSAVPFEHLATCPWFYGCRRFASKGWDRGKGSRLRELVRLCIWWMSESVQATGISVPFGVKETLHPLYLALPFTRLKQPSNLAMESFGCRVLRPK